LSLTTVLTRVRCAVWSSLVIVQVTVAPLGMVRVTPSSARVPPSQAQVLAA